MHLFIPQMGDWDIPFKKKKAVIPCVYIVLYRFRVFILKIFHMVFRIILEVNKAATFPTVWIEEEPSRWETCIYLVCDLSELRPSPSLLLFKDLSAMLFSFVIIFCQGKCKLNCLDY